MVKTIELSPGVTLRYFPDNRFKQGALSIQFLRPMCREEAALNALLPDVLLRGCQSAPDMRRITLRLDDLYGASVGALVRRVGDIQTTGLSCSFMDDRFALQGDRILVPMVEFLRELLLEPVLENGIFSEEFVEGEKKVRIAHLEGQRNDKRSYAGNQLLKTLCRDDSYGIPRLGEIEDVKRITAKTLHDHYRKVLRESPIHLFYVGSAPVDTVAALLKPVFSGLAPAPISLPAQTGLTPPDYSEHEEALPVTQGKLCMGYTTPINLRHSGYAAIQVVNTVLGAGMTSKLFMQVREKMSLCYDIGSSFHGSKGIMTVSAGIEFDKKDVVLAEIKRQLAACQEGDISAEELLSAKEALLSSLRATHDSPGVIEGYYASAALSGIGMTPDVFMEKIRAVTVEDAAQAARTLQLNCVYFLKGVQ